MNTLFSRIHCAIRSLVESLCKRLDRTMLKSHCFKGKAVFGPVRSRRLGYFLGINTMKCKMCTYDCVYCQVGQTACRSTCRDSCIGAYELACVVRKKLDLLSTLHIPIEYIAFMPQGEPALDDNLAQKIKLLRGFGYKIAVITNASLLWNERLQEDMFFADYVSIKIDTVNEDTWRRLNRPHSRLRFQTILDGVAKFSRKYQGILTTETMIVKNINDTVQEMEAIGGFLESIPRKSSYFTIPTRPPMEPYATSPDQHVLEQLADTIRRKVSNSEILFTPEEDDFYGAGEAEDEIIAMLSAQPMKVASVEKFALDKNPDGRTLHPLLEAKRIALTEFNTDRFYTIPVPQASSSPSG